MGSIPERDSISNYPTSDREVGLSKTMNSKLTLKNHELKIQKEQTLTYKYDRITRSGTGGRNTYLTKKKSNGKMASSEIWKLNKYKNLKELWKVCQLKHQK